MDNFTGLSSSVIKTRGIIHLSPLNKQKTADATRMHESDTHIKCHYEIDAVHIYSTCNFLIKYNAYLWIININQVHLLNLFTALLLIT